ncbi:DUF4167 domain-containing protein [Bartonella sp. HY329]|uniref:DUF4167 domain-containing protein n=1 Tax=unclassified Bartonella TaxID=2645622 RepID=UPI0021C897A2|nr:MULTISPECIES: DUF4167 domain-containing protein [unclassified Bartonella]UXM95364.1 DUF4167 domain-containing protein [Bartonella sp. HY329]UXN09689.1 DUF4167 domain-containing protein [Bartonella sp. HY328]
MRPQQNRRMRGRSNNNNNNNNNNRRGPNPLTRNYESSGPDVKIRGNAQHIADKYLTLSRDAQSSGDRVMAENYLQHAEHYMRIILSAQGHIQQSSNREEHNDDNFELVSADTNEVVENEPAGTGPQPIVDHDPEVASFDTGTAEHNGKARDRSYNGRNSNGLRRNPRQPRNPRNSERNYERDSSNQNRSIAADVNNNAQEEVASIASASVVPASRNDQKNEIEVKAAEPKVVAVETAAPSVDAKEKPASKPRATRTRAAKVIDTDSANADEVVVEKPRRKRRTTKAEVEQTEA